MRPVALRPYLATGLPFSQHLEPLHLYRAWPTTTELSRRSFANANSPARKTFAFTLILREGVAPTTAFGVLGGI